MRVITTQCFHKQNIIKLYNWEFLKDDYFFHIFHFTKIDLKSVYCYRLHKTITE